MRSQTPRFAQDVLRGAGERRGAGVDGLRGPAPDRLAGLDDGDAKAEVAERAAERGPDHAAADDDDVAVLHPSSVHGARRARRRKAGRWPRYARVDSDR